MKIERKKIERKITFVVAGIELDSLAAANFLQRAYKLLGMCLVLGINEEHEVKMLLSYWRSMVNNQVYKTDAEVVTAVMELQMPKPLRKPSPPKAKTQQYTMEPEDDNPPN